MAIDIVLPDSLTEEHADNMARRWSASARPLYVVTYADPKSERVVVNVYLPNTPNVKRIGQQIKRFKARVFQYGKLLDDSIFAAVK